MLNHFLLKFVLTKNGSTFIIPCIKYCQDWTELAIFQVLDYVVSPHLQIVEDHKIILAYLLTLPYNDLIMKETIQTKFTSKKKIIKFFDYLLEFYQYFSTMYYSSQLFITKVAAAADADVDVAINQKVHTQQEQLSLTAIYNWLKIMLDIHFITLLSADQSRQSLISLQSHIVQGIKDYQLMSLIHGMSSSFINKVKVNKEKKHEIVGDYVQEIITIPF